MGMMLRLLQSFYQMYEIKRKHFPSRNLNLDAQLRVKPSMHSCALLRDKYRVVDRGSIHKQHDRYVDGWHPHRDLGARWRYLIA